MANTRSAAKQARGAIRRRARNRVQNSTVRTSEKKIRALAKAGKTEDAIKLLPEFQSQIDRAAKKGRCSPEHRLAPQGPRRSVVAKK